MMRVYHCKAYIVSYRGYGPNPRNLIDIQNMGCSLWGFNPTWPPKRSCFVRGFRVNFSFTKLVMMNLRCQSEETNAMSSRNPKKRREQKSSNDSILLANMEIFMIQMIKRLGRTPFRMAAQIFSGQAQGHWDVPFFVFQDDLQLLPDLQIGFWWFFFNSWMGYTLW